MKCAAEFAANLCSGTRLVGWTDQRRGWWKARRITLTSADLVTSCASRPWAVGQQSSHLVRFAFYTPHLCSTVNFFSFFFFNGRRMGGTAAFVADKPWFANSGNERGKLFEIFLDLKSLLKPAPTCPARSYFFNHLNHVHMPLSLHVFASLLWRTIPVK